MTSTMAEQLWETGFEDCVRHPGHCRTRACTAAQDVLCCGKCPHHRSCASACPEVKKVGG